MWENDRGEAPTESWTKRLQPFPSWVVYYAVMECVKHHPKWPPTIGEFLQICEGVPAHKNPMLTHAPQIEQRGGGPCPGRSAYKDLVGSGIKAGDEMYLAAFDGLHGYYIELEKSK